MDIFLNPHVETLWKMMREKCIVQYFQPYLSVSLITMKESFGFDDVDEVEDVIASLIESKRIVGARIDGVNRTLTSMSVKGLERRKRKMMMSKIGMMGDKLIGEVEGMILRMSCLENNIIVTDDSKSNNRRGRGHGRGGPMSNVPYDRVVYSSDDEYFDML
jgi:COP9 signalosome complex subunit 1